jgi:hypothetical protein
MGSKTDQECFEFERSGQDNHFVSVIRILFFYFEGGLEKLETKLIVFGNFIFGLWMCNFFH